LNEITTKADVDILSNWTHTLTTLGLLRTRSILYTTISNEIILQRIKTP